MNNLYKIHQNINKSTTSQVSEFTLSTKTMTKMRSDCLQASSRFICQQRCKWPSLVLVRTLVVRLDTLYSWIIGNNKTGLKKLPQQTDSSPMKSCFAYPSSAYAILLMEEILRHPTCMKPLMPYYDMYIYVPYQLMQDFFHQQYDWNCLKALNAMKHPCFSPTRTAPPQLTHKQGPSVVAPHPTLIALVWKFSVCKVAYRR